MKTLCLPVLSLCAAACHFGEPAAATPPIGAMPSNLVLRSYDVPGDGAAQVRAVLKDMFWAGSDGRDSQKYLGRAEVAPNGRIVVTASESMQEGVKAFIDSLDAHPPKPAATIETSYWLVTAAPGKSGPHPAALSEVASALQQIERTDGPMEFTLAEKLSMTQLSGEQARVNGRDAEVKQTIAARAETVTDEMSISFHAQHFESRVNLKSGQLLVLGSAGTTSKDKDEAQHALYVLMRATLHDGQSP